MMKLLCAVAVATALQLVVAHSDIPVAVRDGFNAARSGNIILSRIDHRKPDGVISLLDDSNTFFTSPADADSIPRALPLKHVADVRARSLGLTTPNPAFSTSAFGVRSDLFRRPKANVLLTVESLGSESVDANGLSHLSAVLSRYPSMSLSDASYPPSAVATAATLATGATPAEHGVIGNAWKSGANKVHAYSGASAWSHRATTADVLSQTFGGEALCLSVSADPQHANAFGTHPLLPVQDSRNAVNVALKDGSFVPLQRSATFAESFAVTQTALLESLSTSALFQGSASRGVALDTSKLVGDAAHRSVAVTYTTASGKSETVVFDLSAHSASASTAAATTFFSELMYIESLSATLRSRHVHHLVTDNVPDLITVSLTGLTGIIDAHGRNSREAIAAMRLLDVAIPQLLEQLTSVYGARAVSQLVLLGTHRSAVDAVDTREVLATVTRLLPSLPPADVRAYYPVMYVERESVPMSVPSLCNVLRTEVAKLNFAVYCPEPEVAVAETIDTTTSPFALFELSEAQVLATTLGATVNYTAGTTSVFRYQIVLWLCIALAIAVLMAAYSLAWMTFRKDTLLYSTFNPQWEQRKRQ